MPVDVNAMPAATPPSRASRAADPRALLLSVLLVVIASLSTVRSIGGMSALFLFVVVWHMAVAGAPATFRDLRRVAPLALLILAINALLVPGDPLVALAGHRVVSAAGVRDGIFFALRLGIMLMAVSGLIAGSRAEGLALAVHDLLRRVSRPLADHMAFFAFLSAGFVPLFIDETHRVQTVQAFRRGALDRGLRDRAGSVRMWLIPVLMSAVRRSGQLALAVELRDTRSRLIPSLPALKMRATDVAWLVSVVAVVAVAS